MFDISYVEYGTIGAIRIKHQHCRKVIFRNHLSKNKIKVF